MSIFSMYKVFQLPVSVPGPAEESPSSTALHPAANMNLSPETPLDNQRKGWESLSKPAQEVEIRHIWPNLITGHLRPFSPLLLAHCDSRSISHTAHQHAVACPPLPTPSPYAPQHAAVIAFPISPQRQQLPWQLAMILISLVCFQGQHTRAGT